MSPQPLSFSSIIRFFLIHSFVPLSLSHLHSPLQLPSPPPPLHLSSPLHSSSRRTFLEKTSSLHTMSTPLNNSNQDHDCVAHGPSTLDIGIPSCQEALGASIDRSITPNHEPRVFFFDIDNCLYPKTTGIPDIMREKYVNMWIARSYSFSGGLLL